MTVERLLTKFNLAWTNNMWCSTWSDICIYTCNADCQTTIERVRKIRFSYRCAINNFYSNNIRLDLIKMKFSSLKEVHRHDENLKRQWNFDFSFISTEISNSTSDWHSDAGKRIFRSDMLSFAYQLAHLQYIFIIANVNICFVAFCTTFFFLVSTRMCNANNSFEFRMSWNRKLVILDSGNHRFCFVARHSYCCCCGVSVPFFFWQMAGSLLSQSIHSYAGLQYSTC